MSGARKSHAAKFRGSSARSFACRRRAFLPLAASRGAASSAHAVSWRLFPQLLHSQAAPLTANFNAAGSPLMPLYCALLIRSFLSRLYAPVSGDAGARRQIIPIAVYRLSYHWLIRAADIFSRSRRRARVALRTMIRCRFSTGHHHAAP